MKTRRIIPALAFLVLVGGQCGDEVDDPGVAAVAASELEAVFDAALARLTRHILERERDQYGGKKLRFTIAPLPENGGMIHLPRDRGIQRSDAVAAWNVVITRHRTASGWLREKTDWREPYKGVSDPPPPSSGSLVNINLEGVSTHDGGGYAVKLNYSPTSSWARYDWNGKRYSAQVENFDAPGQHRAIWVGLLGAVRLEATVTPAAEGGWIVALPWEPVR